MTLFENFLIDKGYIRFTLETKTMTYKRAKGFTISSMTNLDYRYIHSGDKDFLDLIDKGVKVTDKKFKTGIRKNEIVFGLHEAKKPCTLIYPRPNVRLKKIIDNEIIISNQNDDDSMNVMLRKVDFDTILESMFDRSKIIEIDLT